MNEQVIDDLYNRAVSLGYKKDRNSYVKLIHSNPSVFNDSYSYVKSKGYKKSTNDFSELIGLAPKKKVPTEVSKPSVGSSVTTKTPQKQSSDSSKPDGIYKFPTNPKANYKKEAGQWYVDPNGGTKFQPLTKGDVAKRVKVLESQAKREFNPYLETEEKIEFKAETKQVKPTEKVVGVEKKAQDVFKKEFQALDENNPIVIQKNTQDKKTNELIAKATTAMNLGETEGIVELKKIFNQPGYNLFDFEETGAGDAVKVINKKTGESKVFAFDTEDKTEMDKLTAFVNMNVKYKAIGDLTEESKKLQEQIDATYDPNKKLELSRKLKEVNNKLKIEESVRLSDATTDKNKAWSIYDKDAQQNAKAKIDSQLIRSIDYREKKKDLDKRQADLDAALKNNKITYEDYKTKYLPSILAEKEQLSVEEKEIKSANSDLTYESERLNEVAGYNMLAQAERGDFLSGISASFLKGVESPFRLIAGAAGVKTEKGFMMDELLAGLATDEYISDKNRSNIEKVLFSVSESIGASAGGAALTGGVGGVMSGPGATLGTYALSYYSLKDEIDSDPDMANVSEGEKMLLSGVYGGVIGLLDKFGLSKSLSKNPLGKKVVNGIVDKVLTSLPKNATADMIEAAVNSEVKTVIAKGIVNTAGGFINEGATEGLQEFADVTIRDLYNKAKGKELLDKPKTWGEIFERAGESFWLGGLGGAAMSGATQAVEVPKQLRTVGQLKSIERIIDNPDMMDIFTDDLKVKVLNGEMSASKAKAAVNEMRESQAVFNMIPADVENKYAAFKLISEREFLSKEIEGKDPALVEDKKQRVNQIEEELRTLPKKQEVSVESESVIPDEISSLNDDEQVIFNVETLEEVPEQFRDRAVKKKGMEVTLRRKILGLPIGKETKRILGDGYRYELTGKEAKDYAIQERSTEEVLPREQEQAGEARSQREGMGQSIKGEEVTQEGVKEVEDLRAQEQAELIEALPNAKQYMTDGKVDRAKITDENDLKVFDEIYNKYDKIITPLIREAKVEETPNERKIAFHGGNLSEGIKGVLYISEEEDQAKEYAEGNEGEVNKIDVTDLNIADEDTVYEIIKETGFQPKDGEYSVDELNLFELIDSRFETSLSDEDLSKLGEILADKGIDAVRFTDTNLKTLKQDVENIAVFNTSKVKLAEEAPIVEETTKENVAETEQVTEESEADQMIRLQGLLAKSNKTFVTKVINILKKTGLAKKVSMLNSKQIENKLKSFGINPDVAKQVAVWHGSPHSFDKFTTAAMGTGEGFQAFGWGLYFTDLKSIANTYAEKLSKNTYKYNGLTLDELEDNNMLVDPTTQLWIRRLERIKPVDREEAIEWFDNKKTGIAKSQHDEILNIINSIEIIPPSNRNLYKVSLHKGKQPSDYDWLVWDKEITRDQMKKILDNDIDGSITEALEDNFSELYDIKTTDELLDTMYNIGITGGDFYKILSKNIGDNPSGKDASLALLSAGIDGIKYPAESISRGATSDTARGFNYVVFDENAITIEEQIQFQKSLAAKGVQLITNGFVHKGEVYINSDNLNPETPIHEFSHLFNAWLKQNNKELYNKGIDLVKAELNNDNSEIKDVIDYVKSTQPNLSGDALYEEILTQLTGEKGAQLIKTNSAIGNWLKEFWKSIKDKLGLLDVTPEQLSKMTVSEFAEASAVQLLKGQKIGDAEVDAKFQKATEGMSAADIVRIGKASGISNTVIKKYLKDNGYTNYNSLFPSTKPSPAAKAAKAITKKPTPKMVTVNEMDALKDQIRLEARAARGAKANIKENIKKISTLIKSMVTKGNSNIEQRHLKYIFNKLASTNLTSDASVDKLLDYIFNKMTDVNYLNKLDEIAKINKAIKSSKNMVAEIKYLADMFTKIDLSQVTNIDKHLEIANKLKESLARYTKKTDPTGVEFRKNVDYQELYDYVSKNEGKLKTKIEKSLSDIYDKLFGDGASDGMSDEDMIDNINKAKADKVAEMRDIIEAKLEELKNTIDEDTPDVVKKAVSLDPKLIPMTDLIDIINGITMYMDNGIVSGMKKIVAKYDGLEAANKSKIRFKRLIGVTGRKMTVRYNNFQNYIANILYKKINKEGDVEQFEKESGHIDIELGNNRAQLERNNKEKSYKLLFKKVKGFNKSNNIVERRVISHMQRKLMDDEKQKTYFQDRKKLIKNSIDNLKNSDNESLFEEGKLLEEAAIKLGVLNKDGSINENSTVESINSKTEKFNVDAVKYIQEMFSDIYDALYEHSLGFYNTLLERDINYTPDVIKNTKPPEGDDKQSAAMSDFSRFTGMLVKKAGVLMKTDRPSSLTDKYISLDFDQDMFSAYESALRDLYTSEYKQKFNAYRKSDAFKDIMGRGKNGISIDAKLINDRYDAYINIKEGNIPIDKEGDRIAKKFLNNVGLAGTLYSLGSFKNVIAQSVPTWMDAIISTKSYKNPARAYKIISDSFDPRIWDFVARSNSQVALRGKDAIRFTETVKEMLKKDTFVGNAKKTVGKSLKFIPEQILKITNQYPDKVAAIGTWMGYYREYLEKNNLPLDLSTPNPDAVNYAEIKTKIQILPSDASERGSIATNNSASMAYIRQTAFPFSAFSMGSKNRIYGDIIRIIRGDRLNAANDLLGAMTGLISFQYINVLWKVYVLRYLASKLFGDDEDEEEVEKIKKSALSTSISQQAQDIFSPTPILDFAVPMFGNKIINALDLGLPEEQAWIKHLEDKQSEKFAKENKAYTSDEIEEMRSKFFEDNQLKLREQEGLEYWDKFGALGVGFKVGSDLIDIAKAASTGKYISEFNGKPVEKNLTENGKEEMKNILDIKIGAIALGLTDINNQAQKRYYKVGKNMSLTDKQLEEYESLGDAGKRDFMKKLGKD